MQVWLEWARGPIFTFAVAFMVLGLLRQVVITAWEMARVLRRAGDKSVPYSQILKATLKWLMPVSKVRDSLLFSLTSIAFHVCILIVPIFLAGHIAILARNFGISWPAAPKLLADVLTILAVITAVALVVQRLSARATRALSRFQDYALPLLIAVPFATGFLVMHPAWNPFSYEAAMLVHVMSANLIFVLMPTTKLSHAVLMPGVHLVSELGWHWPAEAGSKVGIILGKEGDSI